MQLERAAGRVVRVIDRDGAVHAELMWAGDTARVTVALEPDFAVAVVVEPAEDDPLFGRGHPIVVTRAAAAGTPHPPDHRPEAPATPSQGSHRERRTTCSPIDWRAPRRIPAIAAPGALPPGAGSALLDVIAILAADAGVTALRYAGPYPTAALWRALGQCFHTTGEPDAFTAGAVDRALRLAREEIPIDFAPAPFERAWIRGGEVHLRAGAVERARIAGTLYARGGSPGRLVAIAPAHPGSTDGQLAADPAHPERALADGERESRDGQLAAEVWFGDQPWARVAVLAADGRTVDGPHPVPACTSAVIGSRFPAALRAALADVIATLVAPPLADSARGVLADEDVSWADCGAAAARATAGGLEVHAALWDRLAPLGMARLATALAEALAPVVAVRAQARLAAAIAHW